MNDLGASVDFVVANVECVTVCDGKLFGIKVLDVVALVRNNEIPFKLFVGSTLSSFLSDETLK